MLSIFIHTLTIIFIACRQTRSTKYTKIDEVLIEKWHIISDYTPQKTNGHTSSGSTYKYHINSNVVIAGEILLFYKYLVVLTKRVA